MKTSKLFLLTASVFLLAGCNSNSQPALPEQVTFDDFDFNNYSSDAIDSVLEKVQNSTGYSLKFRHEFTSNIENPDEKSVAEYEIAAKDHYLWAYANYDSGKVGCGLYVSDDKQTVVPYYYASGEWFFASEAGYDVTEVKANINTIYDELKADGNRYSANDIKEYGDTLGQESIAARSCVVMNLQDQNDQEVYSVRASFDRILGVIMRLELSYTNKQTFVTSSLLIEVQQFTLSAEIPNFPQQQ